MADVDQGEWMNPIGNPIANKPKPILDWFPSFGPMQFAAGGALGHTVL